MPEDISKSDLEKKVKALEKSLAEYRHAEKEQLMILEALQSVNEIDTLDKLIHSILNWMEKWSGCEAVGIRLKDGDDFPYYTTSGFPEQFVKLERYLCAYNEDGSVKKDDHGRPAIECMCGNIICGRFDPSKNFFTSDGSFWSNCTTRLLSETTDEDRQSRTRNRCNSFGYESVALIPLRSAGETFGLMQFNDQRKGKFSPGKIAAYRRVADQVASSLAKLKTVQALKKSEAQFKAVVENTKEAIGVSKNGRHLFVNTAYLKMFGYRNPEEVIGTPVLELIGEQERERVESVMRAREKGIPVADSYQTKGLKQDGTLFDMEVSVSRYGPPDDRKSLVILRDITQRKQKELIQSVKLRLVEDSSSHTAVEMLQEFLDEAESLAESDIGFYHLVDDNQKTLSLQSWSTNTLKNMCTEYVKEAHYPMVKAGVWGDSFREGKPIVYNDYPSLPHKKGLPEGHTPVTRLMTVPVLRGNKVVAILGVGNKRTDYTPQDVDIVQELADLSWEAISLKNSTEALKESEQRFRTLFEKAPIGIDLVSSQGIPTHVNQALIDLLGYSKQELCSNPFITWTHPDDIDDSLEKIGLVREGKADHVTVEKRYLHKSGRTTWARTEVTGIRKTSGDLDYFIAMVQDITEQKLAETALKESEERFKFLSEATVEGVHIHDKGIVLDANQSFAGILGYDSAEEIIGQNIMQKHLTPESLEKVQTYIASGYQGTYEVVGIRCDGTQFPVEIISASIEYRGKPARVAAARDITERKAAEELLRWYVRRNEILSETASRLLQSSDPKNLIEDLCRKVMGFIDSQVFFNFMQDSDTGRLHLNACAGIPEDKQSEIEWLDHGTAVCGTVAQTRECMICEDIQDSSNPLTALIKAFGIQAYCCHPLMIEDRLLGTLSFGKRSESRFKPEEVEMMKSMANLMAVAVNRIKNEKEKIDLEDQLRQAQRVEAIGRLAGGVAHDLNNMLCPILSYAEMLAADLSPGDDRREQAVEIVNAGFRARDLVRQLLAFSRKQVITLNPIDMNQVVRGIEKMLLRTIPEDIRLEKHLCRDIRPVLADIGQIEQILLNLTVNSADAMPDGGLLTIETGLSDLDAEYAKRHPDVRPGRYVMLSIGDTGVGMDGETLAHVFEPFFSTKGERGTGLGLATVYGIVKQHNGNVWVYSEPDMGTTFKIYLPVAAETPDDRTSVGPKQSAQKGIETILLVEDNDQVRHLGRTILERQGYNLLEANSGEEALAILTSHGAAIHLLLTDVVMPGINGKELYQRATQSYPHLKVLYMSGYTDDIIAHRGVLKKGIQLIQKPFSVDGLATKVREVLDENTAAQD